MTKRCGLAALLLLFVASAGWMLAQLPTGTILGVVKDSSGAVVPNATVTIRNVETDFLRTVTTGEDGAYRAPALPVGHYNLKIEHAGFQTQTQQGLVLDVAQELVVNAALAVGASAQEVVVTAEAPMVNTTNAVLGGLVNEQKMQDLPLNGRNWVDLTMMQSGISQHKNVSTNSPIAVIGQYFSANGATTHSNNSLLDGAMMITINGSTQSSVSNSTLGVEGIREYKVVTNAFSAEYGLFMGSQTTLVSKNGSNQWHGSLFEYLRNSAMDAANYFDTPLSSGGKRLPEFKRNNFGGSFGGPIRRDKTFFFAVFEGVQQRKGLTLVGNALPNNCRTFSNNPCAKTPANLAGNVAPVIQPLLQFFPLGNLNNNTQYTYPFDSPTSEQYGQIRFDQTFSAKDTAFARFTLDRSTVAQPAVSNPNPNYFDNLSSESQFLTASETHIFNSNLLSTARFSLSKTPLANVDATPQYPGASGGVSFIPNQPQLGMGTINVAGITNFSPGLQVHHNQKVYAWSDDFFWTRGRHSFKFGTLMTHWFQHMDLQAQLRGQMNFSSTARFLNAQYTNYQANTPGSVIQRDYTSNTYGFYLQDDLRARSNLTLNLGLRYEFMSSFNEIHGLSAALRNPATDTATTPGPPLKNPSLLGFSPRVGLAWDVRGDGKTSVRIGAGLMYDIGNIGPVLYRAAGATSPVSSVTTVIGPTSGNPTIPLTVPFTFPSTVGKTLIIPAWNQDEPRLLVYNLTIDRQLPAGMGLSVGYAGSRGYDILNLTEGNPCKAEAFVNGVPDWANPTNTGCPLGRTNPAWNTISLMGSSSESWYNSLQVTLNKRLGHGVQFQSSYTWSKLLDEGSGQGIADNSTAQTNPFDTGFDRAPAGFDVTHNYRFNIIYHLPRVSNGSRLLGGLANGWWMSSILSLQTGYPFSPLLSSNRSLSGVLGTNADRPNIVAGRSSSSITSGASGGCGSVAATGNTKVIAPGTPLGTPTLWFDPCAFTIQPFGFLGSAGRNFLRGPGLSNLDYSLSKDTPLRWLGEAGKVEFRAEFFNILNHTNLGMPNATVYSGQAVNGVEDPLATAGRIVTTSTNSRQVQLALRFDF